MRANEETDHNHAAQGIYANVASHKSLLTYFSVGILSFRSHYRFIVIATACFSHPPVCTVSLAPLQENANP